MEGHRFAIIAGGGKVNNDTVDRGVKDTSRFRATIEGAHLVIVTAPNPMADLILVPLLVQQISVPAKRPMWMREVDRKKIEAAS